MEDRRKNAGRLVIGEMLKQVKAPRLGNWRSQRNIGMMENDGKEGKGKGIENMLKWSKFKFFFEYKKDGKVKDNDN